jgi:hypothetical protein
VVSDRLLNAYGNEEQIARYKEGLLPEEELREVLRPIVFDGLEGGPVSKHIAALGYKVAPETFKVLERREPCKGVSAEQYATLKALREQCAKPLNMPGLVCYRKVMLVEKSVLSEGKEIDVIPMALIEISIQDPQARSPAMLLSRRVGL